MQVWKNNMGNGFVLLVTLVTLTGSAIFAQQAPGPNDIELEEDLIEEVPPALKRDPSMPAMPPMLQAPNMPPSMPPMPNDNRQPPQFPPSMPPMPNQGMPNAFDPARPNRPPMGGRPSLRDNMPMPIDRGAARGKVAVDDDIAKVEPQKCTPAKGKFYWNFEEIGLKELLQQIADLQCKNIVINDSVDKSLKMTIIGKEPLTPKDAWDVLVASMASKGLSLIEQGKTWNVSKKADSKSFSTPTYKNGNEAKSNEEIGTLFYEAKHASQEELQKISKILISRDGLAEAIGDKFIMVIDTNSNIRRLGSIFSQIDVEDALNKIHTIKLVNADPKTVERQLRDLFDISAGGPRSRRRRESEGRAILNVDKIIADERTNSLIVVADKDSVDKLKEVVAMIDVDDDSKGGKTIHVKKLKFADAKKIAETLNNVVQQGRGGMRGYGRRRDDDTNELFEGEVKVTAHENTNTLVTVASQSDYKSLLATIEELDERKEQVYVEAAILDIEVKNNDEFGINLFHGLGGVIPGMGDSLGLVANPGGRAIVDDVKSSVMSNSASADAAFGGNSIGALAVLGNFLSGGVAGIVGQPIGTTKIPSFGAVLQALSTNANVDVLSTPYLLTTDNQEAVMSVGDKVPVVRGASSVGGVAGGLGVPIQNVSYEDVKLTFKITPHVGADNNVRLDISQEVNELGAKQVILGQEQHSIRTKSATTTLVLKDQQTGVIGGLISRKTSKTDNKIPWLGDIPILGWLFKSRKTENDHRSLALIVTPYVIKTDDDYRKILERKLKEREEFARLYYGGKIKNYNPHIDYDRKSGPLSTLLMQVDYEMSKQENGGASSGNDTIIKPKADEIKETEPTSAVIVDPAASEVTESVHPLPVVDSAEDKKVESSGEHVDQ